MRNEKVSVGSARHDYGVVLDTDTWNVDAPATEKLRAEMRAERNWSEVPKVLQ